MSEEYPIEKRKSISIEHGEREFVSEILFYELESLFPIFIVAVAGKVEGISDMVLDDEQGDLNHQIVGFPSSLAEPEYALTDTLLLVVVGDAFDEEGFMAKIASAVEADFIDVRHGGFGVGVLELNLQGNIGEIPSRGFGVFRENPVQFLDVLDDLPPLVQTDLAVLKIVSVAQSKPPFLILLCVV